MKKRLLILFMFVALSSFINAQEKTAKKEFKEIESNQEISYDKFNRWSVEIIAGQSKGIKPYKPGYFSSNPDKLFGNFQVNTFGIGARYMFGPRFGLKLDLAYDNINENRNDASLPFEMQQFRFSFQGVVNAIRLFNLEENSGRLGLLLHAGIQASRMTSKTENIVQYDQNYNLTELNGGLIVGFSPQFRLSNNLVFTSDVSILSNYRQHFNWDGSFSNSENNLNGQMITTTLGLSYSFGNGNIHGDYAIIQDKKFKELKELEGRIGDIETLMNDTDKDGVPDYLDVENNSLAGVAVDTKGRMIDKNNNGVPDELEKYVDNSIKNNTTAVTNNVSDGMVLKLINEGYIAAYFDLDKRIPNTGSTDNLGFIFNYLKTNPTKSIEITGHADILGNSNYNQKLSSDRAENVKKILINAGIDASRINIKGIGSDDTIDKNSEYARRLVRKVVFKITN